jgi:hypothetical protein
MFRLYIISFLLITIAGSCSKGSSPTPAPPVPPVVPPAALTALLVKINNETLVDANRYNNGLNAVVRCSFTAPVNRTTTTANISFAENSGAAVNFAIVYENGDSTMVLQPAAPLKNITQYKVNIFTGLKSVAGGSLSTEVFANFFTKIDSAAKFPAISDDALMDLVQRQTFKYFWDFAHPTSGLARERNTSGETVTSGGSGFGIMAIPVAISRSFISRAEGLARMKKIVGFLKNTAQTFHGAFPHWLNGTTGTAIAFSPKDNAADLVETSFLIAGLLTARQYFTDAGAEETALRNDINILWNNVEWDWFRKSNENVLYWHWSPTYTWEMNQPIRGWNECLVTYILGASSTTHSIPKLVYTSGFAGNSNFTNGNTYYGYQLPLGEEKGGPLFFSHYSFLGINPTGLTDAYANYTTQTKNHTLINYSHCRINPNNQFGYSQDCWGLTASDIQNGYTASSPTNDIGVIAPTAALSSFPYTPVESMRALKFFYYVLGDKIWKEYGFTDAFALKNTWFADSYLAIDQGPIIVMMENYRTGLIWNLLTSCPEVKTGMRALGFSAPYL